MDELRPHPSYVRHHLSASASQLSALAALGDFAFREPLRITRDFTVIDGYARWELARRLGRASILCIVSGLTEEDALRWIIQSHRPSRGLNDYSRILLALDLVPSLQEKARANQRAGGQNKGSSNLTEAKRLEVRSEISAVAGVSTGNVTKVRQLRKSVHPTIEQALRNGEIRIHKAWQWSYEPHEKQLENLRLRRLERGIKKKARALVAKHQAKILPSEPCPNSFKMRDLVNLVTCLSIMSADESKAFGVVMAKLDVPGKGIYVTHELARAFCPKLEGFVE